MFVLVYSIKIVNNKKSKKRKTAGTFGTARLRRFAGPLAKG